MILQLERYMLYHLKVANDWLSTRLVLPDPYSQPYTHITIDLPKPAPHSSPSGLWGGHMSLPNLEFIFICHLEY